MLNAKYQPAISSPRRTLELIINSNAESVDNWLKLLHISGLGPAKVATLLEQFHSVAAIFSASRSELVQAGLSKALIEQILGDQHREQIERCHAWAGAAANRHIISRDCAQYPAQLAQTARAPLVLFVYGDCNILHDPQIAMVGSRNASKYGQNCAYEFAKHLSSQGILITSGLALGVDGCSHRGALASGNPTIAVVATGLDRVYPRQHKELAQEIINAGGAIVSEFTIGTSADGKHFPQRNRIIAGLSVATLVVEAALRSGSLITANYTREINRDVFAIPNSIHSPTSKGCHQLIKEGAKLVEDATDILAELSTELDTAMHNSIERRAASNTSSAPSSTAPAVNNLNSEQQHLLAAMGYELVSIDELTKQTEFSAADIASMLLILELEGYVYSEAGGRYRRSDKQ